MSRLIVFGSGVALIISAAIVVMIKEVLKKKTGEGLYWLAAVLILAGAALAFPALYDP